MTIRCITAVDATTEEMKYWLSQKLPSVVTRRGMDSLSMLGMDMFSNAIAAGKFTAIKQPANMELISVAFCHSVIYRSRKYWYGNSDPWDCVREEIQHVWPGESNLCKGSQNAAQKVLEGFQYIAETASSVSAAPTRRIGSWVADQINPAYWKLNAEIRVSNRDVSLYLALKPSCLLGVLQMRQKIRRT